MTINERVRMIIDGLGLNNRTFSQSVGIDPAVLHNIASEKGRGSKPSFEVLEKILLSFDNISPDFLITGKGPMFRESKNQMYIKKEENRGSPNPNFGGRVRGKVMGENPVFSGENTDDQETKQGEKEKALYTQTEPTSNQLNEPADRLYKPDFKTELTELAVNQGRIIMIIAEQLGSIQDKLDILINQDQKAKK